MEKILAVLVILLGIFLIVPNFVTGIPPWFYAWIIPLVVVVIGIIKLISAVRK